MITVAAARLSLSDVPLINLGRALLPAQKVMRCVSSMWHGDRVSSFAGAEACLTLGANHAIVASLIGFVHGPDLSMIPTPKVDEAHVFSRHALGHPMTYSPIGHDKLTVTWTGTVVTPAKRRRLPLIFHTANAVPWRRVHLPISRGPAISSPNHREPRRSDRDLADSAIGPGFARRVEHGSAAERPLYRHCGKAYEQRGRLPCRQCGKWPGPKS